MVAKQFIAFVLLASVADTAQSPQTPVFRGGTLIAPLTVTVLDKNGRPVTDLQQSEFTVFEDGVKQDIRAFFPQPFTTQPVSPGESPTLNRSVKSDLLAPETRRTFLLVLGYGRIQYPAKAVDGALSFVREHLLPQDLIAVLGFNRATDFTTDHQQVAAVLERYKRDHERIIADISTFRRGHLGIPSPPLSPEIQSEIDAVFTGQTPAEALASMKGTFGPRGVHMRSAVEMLLADSMNMAQRANERASGRELTPEGIQNLAQRVLGSNLSDAIIVSDMDKVYAGLEYLRALDGEKHLVLLGPRIWFKHKEDDVRLATRATDARVVLDMIHTAGVERPPKAGEPIVQNLAIIPPVLQIASSMNIAEYTGGYYTGVSYADKALAHLDESTRFTYLLGYAPSKPALDGSLRQVRVTVNRPGVTVLFQHQYHALEDLPPLDLKDLIVSSRMNDAASYDTTAKDIRMQVRASEMPHLGGPAQLRVDVTIDAARLAFASASAGRTAGLEIEIFCGNDKETLVGDLTQHLDVTADDETYARFLKDGIPFSARVPITAPAKFVKVVVYDSGADLIGTFTLTMRK